MKELKIFENNEFGEVRTTVIDDEPYFALNDICRILEINKPSPDLIKMGSLVMRSSIVWEELNKQTL